MLAVEVGKLATEEYVTHRSVHFQTTIYRDLPKSTVQPRWREVQEIE
jgi:hypothetical protein